ALLKQRTRCRVVALYEGETPGVVEQSGDFPLVTKLSLHSESLVKERASQRVVPFLVCYYDCHVVEQLSSSALVSQLLHECQTFLKGRLSLLRVSLLVGPAPKAVQGIGHASLVLQFLHERQTLLI